LSAPSTSGCFYLFSLLNTLDPIKGALIGPKNITQLLIGNKQWFHLFFDIFGEKSEEGNFW
jgi:hypothetical protein